jgi:hypothetical protein
LGSAEHDGALLRTAAHGDCAAFEVFFARLFPVITGFHLRRVRSRQAAFDLTAETFAARRLDGRVAASVARIAAPPSAAEEYCLQQLGAGCKIDRGARNDAH